MSCDNSRWQSCHCRPCVHADPFTRVVFLNQSKATERLRKTTCPTWDQTLIFDTVEIHGDPQSVADNPPDIIIEIFDYDSFVSYFDTVKQQEVVK